VKSVSSEELASDALHIAKNADYLSTHIAFTKRLGDIAYRLYYQPIDKRKNILEAELAKLNASGTMGGDPLNRVKLNNYHTRVARIPIREGHVFRSKERTPVLLLVETLDEEAEFENEKKELTPFPSAKWGERKDDSTTKDSNTVEITEDSADKPEPSELTNDSETPSEVADNLQEAELVQAPEGNGLEEEPIQAKEEGELETVAITAENDSVEPAITSLTDGFHDLDVTEEGEQKQNVGTATPRSANDSLLCGSQEGLSDDASYRRKYRTNDDNALQYALAMFLIIILDHRRTSTIR
jgi:hypothetical protein